MAINKNNREIILSKLLEYSKTIPFNELFITLPDFPDAATLIYENPYAFTIAACLDRGMPVEVIWTVPYFIRDILGHLDPFKIYRLSLDDLEKVVQKFPRKLRYWKDAPRTIHGLTTIVVEECKGDASLMWKDKGAGEVKRTLRSIFGVGEGIANMTLLLIEQAFGAQFPDLDRPMMDIKPDVHTKRVLFRLGVSTEQTESAAIQAAKWLFPEFPGQIDGALWTIGRKWCQARIQDCPNCVLDDVCEKVGL